MKKDIIKEEVNSSREMAAVLQQPAFCSLPIDQQLNLRQKIYDKKIATAERLISEINLIIKHQ